MRDNTYQVKHQNKVFLITILCVAIGALARFAYCIRYPVQPRDAYMYESIILNWEETGQIPEYFYGIPFSLYLFKLPYHFLALNIIETGIIINVLLGVFSIVLSICYTERLFGNLYVDAIAGLAVATHPMLINLSCVFLRENLYIFFSFLMLFSLTIYYKENKIMHLLEASIFSSISFLCRLEGLELLMFFYIVLLFMVIYRRIGIKKAIIHGMLFIGTFLAVALPIIYCFNKQESLFLIINSKTDFSVF